MTFFLTQVILQIFRRHAMETRHPSFESTVIGIDVLDMVNPSDHANSRGQVEGAMGDLQVLRDGPVHAGAIATQDDILSQERAQRRFDFGGGGCGQLEIRSRPGAVTDNQHGNLILTGSTRMNRMPALAGWALQMPLTFAGIRKIGFIRLGNALQALGFGLRGQLQEAVSPAETGVLMDTAATGRLADG